MRQPDRHDSEQPAQLPSERRYFAVPPLAGERLEEGLAAELFRRAEIEPQRPLLARRLPDGGRADGAWADVSAGRFRDEVLALAAGLLLAGLGFGDRVGVMSRTRYEWTLLDYALWSIGAQPVPVYPTASPAQVAWILGDSGAAACVVENEDQAMTLGSVCDRLPGLRHVWQLDAGALDALTAAGADPAPGGAAEAAREQVLRLQHQVGADTVATVVYTSGTTGRPKGCPLTHGNFAAETDNLIARYPELFDGRRSGSGGASMLLFLPLAHIFARMAAVAALRAGVRLGHQPDLAQAALAEALASFRPTVVPAVPHVFERLAGRARQAAEDAGRGAVFEKAWETAVQYGEAVERHRLDDGPGPSAGLRLRHQFYEQAVFGRVRAALGGRLRHAVVGGSAMDRELGLFFLGAGITVIEGYGLTETTAAVTANPLDAPRLGTVGLPVPGVEVAVARDDEVWVRGAQVFGGYLGTAAPALSRDGWLPTGDLGRLDERGYLTITGRKKEVLVTSYGKTVSPAVLEERVRRHPLVGHCLLVGDDQPYIGALLTFDPDALASWLRRHRLPPTTTPDEAAQLPDLIAELDRAVATANAAVSRAEAIRAFRVLPYDFHDVPELVTPSLKLRRRAALRHCAPDITALYAAPPPAQPLPDAPATDVLDSIR